MARKPETFIDKLDTATRQVMGAAERIEGSVENLAKLEAYLPKKIDVISLFRLHLNSIREDLKYLKRSDG